MTLLKDFLDLHFSFALSGSAAQAQAEVAVNEMTSYHIKTNEGRLWIAAASSFLLISSVVVHQSSQMDCGKK